MNNQLPFDPPYRTTTSMAVGLRVMETLTDRTERVVTPQTRNTASAVVSLSATLKRLIVGPA